MHESELVGRIEDAGCHHDLHATASVGAGWRGRPRISQVWSEDETEEISQHLVINVSQLSVVSLVLTVINTDREE